MLCPGFSEDLDAFRCLIAAPFQILFNQIFERGSGIYYGGYHLFNPISNNLRLLSA
jgi:hypothetical protein